MNMRLKNLLYTGFQSYKSMNKNMPINLSVEPDSMIRVLMEYKSLDNYIEIPEQKLITPKRTGFVLVEWGGVEIK